MHLAIRHQIVIGLTIILLLLGGSVFTAMYGFQAITPILQGGQASTNGAAAAGTVSQFQIIILGLGIGCAVAVVLVSCLLFRSVSRRLRQVAQGLATAAAGKPTEIQLPEDTQDIIGSVVRSADELISTIRKVSGALSTVDSVVRSAQDLEATTNAMKESTEQVAESIAQIAQGANEQAQSASSIQEQMAKLGTTIGEIADGAQEQAQQAETASNAGEAMVAQLANVSQQVESATATAEETLCTAEEGQSVVKQALAAINSIRESATATTERVSRLGDLSGQIGVITETITDIASQTNLLALNAAIEAARAGEQGRGFAVVAQEVRQLAEKVASSAKEIAALIDHIRSATDEAVTGMNAVNDQVAVGTEWAQTASHALKTIVKMIAKTKDHLAEITEASREVLSASEGVQSAVASMAAVAARNKTATDAMAANAKEVVDAVSTIAASTQETAASAEEVSATTEELSAGAQAILYASQQLTAAVEKLQNSLTAFQD